MVASPNHAFRLAELRAVLYEAVHNHSSARRPLHPYFVRLCAKHDYKEAPIAIAQHPARILFKTWREGRTSR